MFENVFDDGRVTVLGHALIRMVEVIVVVVEAQGEAFQDGGGQFRRLHAPLLAGIAVKKGPVQIDPRCAGCAVAACSVLPEAGLT